jgi:hypothetical protein
MASKPNAVRSSKVRSKARKENAEQAATDRDVDHKGTHVKKGKEVAKQSSRKRALEEEEEDSSSVEEASPVESEDEAADETLEAAKVGTNKRRRTKKKPGRCHISPAYKQILRVTSSWAELPPKFRHWIWFEEFVLRKNAIRTALLRMPHLNLAQFLWVMRKLYKVPTKASMPPGEENGKGDRNNKKKIQVKGVYNLTRKGPVKLRHDGGERKRWLAASFGFYRCLLSHESKVELIPEGENADDEPLGFDVVAKAGCSNADLAFSLWGQRAPMLSHLRPKMAERLRAIGHTVWQAAGKRFYLLSGPILLLPRASSSEAQLEFSVPRELPEREPKKEAAASTSSPAAKPAAAKDAGKKDAAGLTLFQERPRKRTKQKEKKKKQIRHMLCAQVRRGASLKVGERLSISHPPIEYEALIHKN